MDNKEKTHVRYTVQYQDRNYEYALHSSKRHFIRNLADVVNILEYCVTQDLKKDGLYEPNEKMYNYHVVRLVNDEPDGNFNPDGKFMEAINALVNQLIKDNIQRNSK